MKHLLIATLLYSFAATGFAQEVPPIPVDRDPNPPEEESTRDTMSVSGVLPPDSILVYGNPPVYDGGMDSLTQFFSKNLKYPEMEKSNAIEGQVWITYMIDEQGKVDSVFVFKGVSPGLDKEALRVAQLIEKFKPPIVDGKPSKLRWDYPVVFKLR